MTPCFLRPSKASMNSLNALLAVSLFLLGGCAGFSGIQKSSYQFALIGDMPYTDFDSTNCFPNLIREMNSAPLAFVVHDGDLKSGAVACTDDLFWERHRQFQTSQHPF